MNWQDVQDAIAEKLKAIPNLNAEIVLPAEKPKNRDALFVELAVSEVDTLPWTNHAMLHMGSVEQVVNVPLGCGSEQAFNVAAMIAGLYSPIETKKAGFRAGSHFAYVRKVRQMPPNENDSLFRINVRVEIDIYVQKGG